MAYEDIYARYNNLFNAQNNALAQKKDATIANYQNQQKDLNNQYADLANGLNAKKVDTQNQYANLYKGLDQQNIQAKDQNYTDRNAVDTGVNQNLNRVQEIMAKNGWLGGGENLQAQLQSNSDRMNGFGNADKNMTNTLNTILNNRNTYQGQEQSALNDLNNQMISNDREKNTKLQAIMDAINTANSNYNSDSTALRANLDAQAMGEIANLQEAERQRQFQAQQAAEQRAAAARSASSSRSSNSLSNTMSSGSSYNKAVADINDVVNGSYNLSEKQRVLQRYIDDLGSQQGNEAVALNRYAQEALGKVNQQMSNFVNSGRYAGYENRRM